MRITKVEMVYQSICRQIEQGTIATGDKLPSIRNAAEDFMVSKNTIVNVYDRLVASGIVSAKQGSGFVVNSRKPMLVDSKPENVREASDIISLLRTQLEKNYLIRVGDGRPPASWMEETIPKRHSLKSMSVSHSDTSGYGSPFGNSVLRGCIAAQHQALNLDVSPNQIVTTFGANHALDLIIRRFLLPGDTVLVDDPGYYPLFAKLRFSKFNFVGVKRTPQGPDLAELRSKAEQLRPALFFTQSLSQNPTGSSIDLPTAHAVLQIAAQNNFLVIDDDPFVDLPGVTGTRLAALDGFKNVVYVGTYSKILSASFRSGFIIAHRDLAANLAELKMITCVNSSRHSEMIIADFINSRQYHKHVKKISGRVVEASDAVAQKLLEMGYTIFAPPTYGYYLFLTFPPGVSDLDVAKQAARKGIFLAPGSLFAVDSSASISGLRINVTRANVARFYNFLKSVVPRYTGSGESEVMPVVR